MPDSTFDPCCHYAEAHWRPLVGLFNPWRPTQRIMNWLTVDESLTERLQAVCRDHFNLRLVGQTWSTPRLSETRLLCLPERSSALIRCVKLYDGEQLLVWARTVIPGTAARQALRPLTLLGDKPLGAQIFQDPGLRRYSLDICARPPGIGNQDEGFAAWGRRSLYESMDEPFLVYEYFHQAVFDR